MKQRPVPYWLPEADYSRMRFFIRRMDTSGSVRAAQVPSAKLPLIGFVYLTGGELLAEVDGESVLCYPGQLLLIPENKPFAIRYYEDAKGYTGGFSASLLSDARQSARISKTLHLAFWFDEASFVGELFNMLVLAFEKGKEEFIVKGLDLLLSMTKIPAPAPPNPAVARFLDQIFAPDTAIESVSYYAREAGITANWLGRMVRKETGRSVGAWIDLARLTRAKRLLQETDWPVIDVAVAVGLEDQSYFSRFFRKLTGESPTRFREKMKGTHGSS